MPDIEFIKGEIERIRYRVQRQRREIRQLQRAGIPCASAEALLDRMLNKISDLCADRDSPTGMQGTSCERASMPCGYRGVAY
jgi:hypothetical protein